MFDITKINIIFKYTKTLGSGIMDNLQFISTKLAQQND